MDTLSHGLWALAIFWGTSYRWWAFLIGMIPDLLSFGVYFVQRIASGSLVRGPPELASIPHYVDVLYSITHSFFTWIILAILLYYAWRKYWPIVFAAIAHIALDIPTHCGFYPTPFLEPLSSYRYCGLSWGTPWIFFMNWISLAIVFSLIGYYEWSKRKSKKTYNRKSEK